MRTFNVYALCMIILNNDYDLLASVNISNLNLAHIFEKTKKLAKYIIEKPRNEEHSNETNESKPDETTSENVKEPE
ncbi:UNVERIFIED_CONTAM: hypothetical protein O8I53_11530 [Campylobacter lari]